MRSANFWLLSLLVIAAAAIYPSHTMHDSVHAASDEVQTYSPFDEVLVSIFSPDSNQDHNAIDTITVLIAGSVSQKEFVLQETGLNTSIFEEEIQLSPDLSRFPGDIETKREDALQVTFRIDEDTVVTQSILVNYHDSGARFDQPSYGFGEEARILVLDPDMNRNPDTIDTLSVRVWSETDRGGLSVTLRETGARTGLFEEVITFTPDEESTGTRLRASEGDIITLKYTDNTLPPPAKLAANGIETVEVEEIFASAIFGTPIPPTERTTATEPVLIDAFGESLSQIVAGEQLLIQSEITNEQKKKQPFVYIVQIRDLEGLTVSISWISAELPASESLSVAQSWVPSVPGNYSVEIFVWESLSNPVPISPARTINIQVEQ